MTVIFDVAVDKNANSSVLHILFKQQKSNKTVAAFKKHISTSDPLLLLPALLQAIETGNVLYDGVEEHKPLMVINNGPVFEFNGIPQNMQPKFIEAFLKGFGPGNKITGAN